MYNFFLKKANHHNKNHYGAGEMTQRLRVLATLAKDLGSVPGIHPHAGAQLSVTSVPGDNTLF